MTFACKDIGIRKSKFFVAKTEILHSPKKLAYPKNKIYKSVGL